MYKVLLIGNPNVGKTTLFNKLTYSCEHTGNFHGVTVEDKHKIVKFENKDYDFVDLPGIYSLNCFSFEEEVSRKQILKGDSINLVIADANSLRRNLYLCLQLSEMGQTYKLLINNYDYFVKHGNSLDLKSLNNYFNTAQIIDAKKQKLTKEILTVSKTIVKTPYLQTFLDKLVNKYKLTKQQVLLAFNGENVGLTQQQSDEIKAILPEVVKARYDYIDKILSKCISYNKNFVYGKSKADKLLLNPIIMFVGFLAFFFISIYLIFFLIGPAVSQVLVWLTNFVLINPIMNFLYANVGNVWLIEFFNGGVFNSLTTVLSFLPQVCLLFAFLTILEDSGLISRMAYVFDDFLSIFGLNGKAVYIMLMGLGCNTMSAMASRNMDEKNLKIKTAILNPYISCMARLPIFVLVASALFGAKSYFIVVGLYLLGIAVALILGVILNKTILKNKSRGLLLEFPPLKNIDIKHVGSMIKLNAVDFVKRVFTIILMVGIIVWLLSHTQFNFSYTDNITESILFFFAGKLCFVFAPIGLNNAGILCALIVGILAKELILSIFTISNGVASTSALALTLTASTSLINFTYASAISFLIFALLYSPCISTLAVIKKEAGRFWMWFSLISQLVIAYIISFIVYTALTQGFWLALASVVAISLIVSAIIFMAKKIQHKKCWGCSKCKK